jgi:predicted type IV restriction endonuclease
MQPLNLPVFEPKITKVDGKKRIFDVIRKKYVVLTPEEWVRQHFLNYLITSLNYPKSLIKIESGLQFRTISKRTDILVYDRKGKPWMIVECKAPDIRLDRKSFNQALIYNMTLGAQFITVTNGMLHFCFQPGQGSGQTSFLPTLPAFQE